MSIKSRSLLSADEIEQVRAVTNPGFAKLDERRAGIPVE